MSLKYLYKNQQLHVLYLTIGYPGVSDNGGNIMRS